MCGTELISDYNTVTLTDFPNQLSTFPWNPEDTTLSKGHGGTTRSLYEWIYTKRRDPEQFVRRTNTSTQAHTRTQAGARKDSHANTNGSLMNETADRVNTDLANRVCASSSYVALWMEQLTGMHGDQALEIYISCDLGHFWWCIKLAIQFIFLSRVRDQMYSHDKKPCCIQWMKVTHVPCSCGLIIKVTNSISYASLFVSVSWEGVPGIFYSCYWLFICINKNTHYYHYYY